MPYNKPIYRCAAQYLGVLAMIALGFNPAGRLYQVVAVKHKVAVAPQAAQPTFSPDTSAGACSGSCTVTIASSTTGSTITYCTNASADCTPGTSYSAPATFSTTGTHLCALANASGYSQSTTLCETYTVTTPSPTLVTNAHAEDVNNPVSAALDTRGGTAMAVHVAWYSVVPSVTLTDSITGSTTCASPCNTWTAKTNQLTASTRSQWFYSLNPTVGSQHVFNVIGGSSVYAVERIVVLGGVSSYAYKAEGFGSNQPGASQTMSLASGDTALVGCAIEGSDTLTIASPSMTGLTPQLNVASGSHYGAMSWYLLSASAGTFNPTVGPISTSAGACSMIAFSH